MGRRDGAKGRGSSVHCARAAQVPWLAAAFVYFASFPAAAARFDVRVNDARGSPIADAVVTVVPAAGGAPARTASSVHVIDQKNERFIPYIEVFRPGDEVVFHNSDRTRHNAYSFAPARQFEFVLSPGESSPPLKLAQAGVIAVGCNIHDQMITYFYVTDAPYVARTGADGVAHVDVPAADYGVRVWHPRLRPGSADNMQPATAQRDGPAQNLAFTLSLLPDPRVAPDRERGGY